MIIFIFITTTELNVDVGGHRVGLCTRTDPEVRRLQQHMRQQCVHVIGGLVFGQVTPLAFS